MSEKILCIDISENILTAAVIKKSFKGCTLIEAAEADKNTKNNNTNMPFKWDQTSFEEALKTILQNINLKGCSSSAISIPASLVSFRTLKVPFASESSIRQILQFELNSHLPINNVNYISDFILIKNNDINKIEEISINSLTKSDINNTKKNYYIFTASIPAYVMDIFFPILKKYGLTPEFITPQFLNYAQYFFNNHNFSISSFNAVIQTTERECIILILVKEQIVSVRVLKAINDNDLIEKAVHQTLMSVCQRYQYDINFDEVNKIYINGSTMLDSLVTIFGSSVIKLSNSINSNNSLHSINSVGSAGPPKADSVKSNPAGSFNSINSINLINALSTGLCSINLKNSAVNFCQAEYAAKSFFEQFKSNILECSVFAVITFTIFFISIEYDILNIKKDINIIDGAIASVLKKNFPEIKTIVEPLMQMEVKLREAEKESGFVSAESSSSIKHYIKAVDVLYELSSRIPEDIDIEITRFLLSDRRVTMAGITDNFNTVDKIKTLLERSNLFKNAAINSAAADKSGNKILFNFIIEL